MSDESTEVLPERPTRRVRLILEYDGTEYSGWQTQAPSLGRKRGLSPRPRTIQGLCEDGLRRILRDPRVNLTGSGRTDAGVHAAGQVAHVTTSSNLEVKNIGYGLNSILPRDIRVRSVDEVAADFHSRFDACCREYRYQIWHGSPAPPFLQRYAFGVFSRLDVDAMEEAAALITGTQDLSAFRAAGCAARSPIRTVTTSHFGRHGPLLVYAIRSRAFLRHMVRNIVGALVQVGRGRVSVADFAALIASRDRGLAPPTVAANGLFLYRVEYDQVSETTVGQAPEPVLRFLNDWS